MGISRDGSPTRPSQEVDLIPASQALIGWDTRDDRRMVRVIVLDQRSVRESDELQQTWQSYRYTSGACYRDWLKEHPLTPEFVFSELLIFRGFADSRVAEQAIAEFAGIKECEWARKMIAAFFGRPRSTRLW